VFFVADAFVIYQTHRAFLWDEATDQACELLPSFNSNQLPWFKERAATMRQACAGGDTADAVAINHQFLNECRKGEARMWILSNMLGEREQASALPIPYDETNQSCALSNFLA
jgi:hypothetical protein